MAGRRPAWARTGPPSNQHVTEPFGSSVSRGRLSRGPPSTHGSRASLMPRAGIPAIPLHWCAPRRINWGRKRAGGAGWGLHPVHPPKPRASTRHITKHILLCPGNACLRRPFRLVCLACWDALAYAMSVPPPQRSGLPGHQLLAWLPARLEDRSGRTKEPGPSPGLTPTPDAGRPCLATRQRHPDRPRERERALHVGSPPQRATATLQSNPRSREQAPESIDWRCALPSPSR